jgi:peroxiredoxin
VPREREFGGAGGTPAVFVSCDKRTKIAGGTPAPRNPARGSGGHERTKMVSSNVEAPDWSAIPAPKDDGAARHLFGTQVPSVLLPATNGTMIDLSSLRGLVVVYAYPRTGIPGVDNPPGWDLIPGARGCTPQTCAFRDHFAELKALGVNCLFGLSTQDPAYQREFADRLHLPFPILSDEHLALTRALRLPTFETNGMTLLKRLTLVIRDARIEHVFYPVFPPDRNASDVLGWLAARVH